MNVHVKMPKESAEKMLELKSGCSALAAMPQLVGASSRNQKAAGSTPGLHTHDPQFGCRPLVREHTGGNQSMLLLRINVSLPSSLS